MFVSHRGAHTFLGYRLADGGEVVSLTRRPSFNLTKIPGTHFCYRPSRISVHLIFLGHFPVLLYCFPLKQFTCLLQQVRRSLASTAWLRFAMDCRHLPEYKKLRSIPCTLPRSKSAAYNLISRRSKRDRFAFIKNKRVVRYYAKR
jgi:hypothetical protein